VLIEKARANPQGRREAPVVMDRQKVMVFKIGFNRPGGYKNTNI
jgi:hypothetical protein